MKNLILPVLLLMFIVSCSKDKDATPSLNVSSQTVEFESDGGSVDVNVTSNVSWTAVSSAADWCSVSPASGTNNGSIKITATANTALAEREATVTVSGEGQEKKITVVQDPASVEGILSGTVWEMTSQASGDSNYDDLIGTVIDLKMIKV